jgi:hypothetical protein
MSKSENPSPLLDGDETIRGGYITIDSWVVFDQPHFDGLRMYPIWHQQENVRRSRRVVETSEADGAASQRQRVLQVQKTWVDKMASKRSSRRRDSFWSGLDFIQ